MCEEFDGVNNNECDVTITSSKSCQPSVDEGRKDDNDDQRGIYSSATETALRIISNNDNLLVEDPNRGLNAWSNKGNHDSEEAMIWILPEIAGLLHLEVNSGRLEFSQLWEKCEDPVRIQQTKEIKNEFVRLFHLMKNENKLRSLHLPKSSESQQTNSQSVSLEKVTSNSSSSSNVSNTTGNDHLINFS